MPDNWAVFCLVWLFWQKDFENATKELFDILKGELGKHKAHALKSPTVWWKLIAIFIFPLILVDLPWFMAHQALYNDP